MTMGKHVQLPSKERFYQQSEDILLEAKYCEANTESQQSICM